MAATATNTQRIAFNAIRRFRQKEINRLEKNLRQFGPLPELPESVLAKAPADAPPPFALPNPFLPKKQPRSGRWFEARFSLRRQAELVKKAQACGEMHLLPDGPKKFAAELRAQRVKNSLSPAVIAQLAELELERQASRNSKYSNVAEAEKAASEAKVKSIETRIKELRSQLDGFQKKLKKATEEFDLAELDALDAEADEKLSRDQVSTIVRNAKKLGVAKERLEWRVEDVEHDIEEAQSALNRMAPSAEVHNWAWKAPVHWVPEFKRSEAPGIELGTKLYSGKKRMFKGHLWERKRAVRERKHAILMRDMPARIARYKNYYKKRKPNPLKPSRFTKPPKLPY